MDVVQWISTLLGDFPQLSWLKYVFAGVLLLVILDACCTLLFRSLDGLAGGGRR